MKIKLAYFGTPDFSADQPPTPGVEEEGDLPAGRQKTSGVKKLKIAYFGTPDFSARFLEKLITDKDFPIEVVLVVTQPDKPVGRKKILTPSPVKNIAQKYGIELLDEPLPNILNTKYEILNTIDIALLYAYGEIIPDDLLKAPKHGFWNIHPSLLPLYRGASPIAYPLILGDRETGVTLIQMDKELDHGPIIAQEKYEILETDKRSDLEIKLTNLGYELFKKVMSTYQIRNTTFNQDESRATFTRRLTKDDGFIPLATLKKTLNNEPLTVDELPSLLKPPRLDTVDDDRTSGVNNRINSSKIIYDYFRGLYPWPGIWTLVPDTKTPTQNSPGVTEWAPQGWPKSKRLKITDMEMVIERLVLKKVQLEGKKEVPFEQFKKDIKNFKLSQFFK